MADHLGRLEHRNLFDAALSDTYDRLSRMLSQYQAPATFAFVMAFLLDREEREEFADLLRPKGPDDTWMMHCVREQAAYPEGWFVPSALASVTQAAIHEIACHGFSHRSLGDGEISAPDAERELAAAQAVAVRKGVTLETMIFPRNRVGQLDALKAFGYRGYRSRKRQTGALPAPIANLVEELNLFTPTENAVPTRDDDLVVIPHGHFFNWRQGNRRLIPPAITVQRWKAMLDRAAKNRQIAHLWLHPHNFITGAGTWKPFEDVLVYANRLRDAGRLQIITQAEYCTTVAQSSGGAAVH